jgi:hypothetical protein
MVSLSNHAGFAAFALHVRRSRFREYGPLANQLAVYDIDLEEVLALHLPAA